MRLLELEMMQQALKMKAETNVIRREELGLRKEEIRLGDEREKRKIDLYEKGRQEGNTLKTWELELRERELEFARRKEECEKKKEHEE